MQNRHYSWHQRDERKDDDQKVLSGERNGGNKFQIQLEKIETAAQDRA